MAKLISSQIEQLREIGAYLRQVRQERGISLEDVANQTFIRAVILQALEEGRDENLPEPVFIQGFIRRYADALGIDGQALAKEFMVTPVSVFPTPTMEGTPSTNGVVEPETRENIKVLDKAEDLSSRRSPSWPLIGALGTAVVMVGLLVWGLSNSPVNSPVVEEPQDESAQSQEEAPSEATSEPTGAASPETADAESSQDEEVADSQQPEAPVVAEISLTDRAWISVSVDGNKVFEGILEGGTEETWIAQNSIILTSGNAGGVELAVNGNRATPMGEPGTVQTVTLTPDTNPDTLSQADL